MTAAKEEYRTIPYEDVEKAGPILREDGVVVISNVFGNDECVEKCQSMLKALETICPDLRADQMDRTWKKENLPYGPRMGMYHSLVSNLDALWSIRTSPRVRNIFEQTYSHLRERKVEEFYCSVDGMTVHPPIGPYAEEQKQDWAHLDQSSYNNPFWCIQGQVVLNNSTACFRASPRSHLVYTDLLKASAVEDSQTTNWCLFEQSQYDNVRSRIEGVGGSFQIPIRAERGSVILWLSATVHSALPQQMPRGPPVQPTAENPFPDWRFVAYTCYRPKEDCFIGDHAGRLQQCLKDNRTSNHSGTAVFPIKSKGRSEALTTLLNHPERVYDQLPLTITPQITRLTS
eukprot:CAMPEP_0119133980 /NCGR_PEP_ID=MMETSP1310-20130426/15014_1 /TAXON_ID=464262 /ORGANISM="Genus nov. species nov., Strain RCC2339" /LENGTH=343 /DNA_ID=CAMNT_0007124717 /DNA_START=43 /DNA_END=1074 /DNA_ORIENTATION=-